MLMGTKCHVGLSDPRRLIQGHVWKEAARRLPWSAAFSQVPTLHLGFQLLVLYSSSKNSSICSYFHFFPGRSTNLGQVPVYLYVFRTKVS